MSSTRAVRPVSMHSVGACVSRGRPRRTTVMLSLACALCVGAPGQASYAFPLFGPHSELPGDMITPYVVAVGDLNKDGKQDVVVADTSLSAISAWLGNGDGTFGMKHDFGTGNFPIGVGIGDLNRDGKPDALTANAGSNTVSVLLGTGTGSFASNVDYATGRRPSALAIGDMNRDGKPDVVVTNARDNTVSVLLGDGNGALNPKTDFPVGFVPCALALADLNRDGKLDAVVVNSGSNTVSVLMGDGNGSLGTKTDFGVGVAPTALAVGDLNLDGRADLVVTNAGANTVSVLLRNSGGSYDPKTDFPVGGSPQSVVIADVLWHGVPDLVVINAGSSAASVLVGYGDGTYASKVDYATAPGPHGMAAGDLNSDGRPDLVVATDEEITGAVSILLGQNSSVGTFGSVATCAVHDVPYDVAIGDLNADGVLDLVTANEADNLSYNGTISVLLGNGDGTFAARTDYITSSHTRSVAIADFNRDGKLDAVVGNDYSSLLSVDVLLGAGNGTFGTANRYPVGSYPNEVAVGDFNRDGNPDIAAATTAAKVSILLGNGNGTFQAHVDYSTMTWSTALAIGDVNRDGNEDIVAGNNVGTPHDSVSVLLGNGDGTFRPKMNFASGLYPGSIATGDVNADGNLDLAVANQSYSNTVSVLLGNGDGTFRPRISYVVAPSTDVEGVALGDVNGDGKTDIVAGVEAAHAVAVLYGDGSGNFGPVTLFSVGTTSPYSVAIADLNRDGKCDLVATKWKSEAAVLLFSGGLTAVGGLPPPAGSGARVWLAAPRPNPASADVAIDFSAAAGGDAILNVYDVRGRCIRTIVEGPVSAGLHSVRWDRRSDAGVEAGPGLYFLGLELGNARTTQKLILVRR